MSVAISVDDRVPCIVGILSRTTLTRYKQVIEVKNTHKHEIRLLVEDQLPRSENQKIKASFFYIRKRLSAANSFYTEADVTCSVC